MRHVIALIWSGTGLGRGIVAPWHLRCFCHTKRSSKPACTLASCCLRVFRRTDGTSPTCARAGRRNAIAVLALKGWSWSRVALAMAASCRQLSAVCFLAAVLKAASRKSSARSTRKLSASRECSKGRSDFLSGAQMIVPDTTSRRACPQTTRNISQARAVS